MLAVVWYDVVYILVLLAVVVGAVLWIVTLVRRGGREKVEQRLDRLDRLHAAGRITEAERAEARARLLGTV